MTTRIRRDPALLAPIVLALLLAGVLVFRRDHASSCSRIFSTVDEITRTATDGSAGPSGSPEPLITFIDAFDPGILGVALPSDDLRGFENAIRTIRSDLERWEPGTSALDLLDPDDLTTVGDGLGAVVEHCTTSTTADDLDITVLLEEFLRVDDD